MLVVYFYRFQKREKGRERGFKTYVQLPSYNLRLCSSPYPASARAASIIAAVTPVPQLVIIFLVGSTPLASKTFLNSSGLRKVLVTGSKRSDMGTLILPGICPLLKPSLGSGS